MKALRTLDAFGRTLEDVKVKTSFGGTLTLISFALIFTLTVVEFVDYRRVHLEPSIIVDKSRGERLVVHMNITFPRVPCYRASTLALVAADTAQCSASISWTCRARMPTTSSTTSPKAGSTRAAGGLRHLGRRVRPAPR